MADARDASSVLAGVPSETAFGQSTLNKIAWRLLPLLALGYSAAIMDRSSQGTAPIATTINRGKSLQHLTRIW
jgi:hypothetical protein